MFYATRGIVHLLPAHEAAFLDYLDFTVHGYLNLILKLNIIFWNLSVYMDFYKLLQASLIVSTAVIVTSIKLILNPLYRTSPVTYRKVTALSADIAFQRVRPV